MTTPKLKKLLHVASEIINLYLDQYDCNPTDPSFTIHTFYDSTEKNSEVVNIDFANWYFNNEFLEPLTLKLHCSPIKWSITREEKSFQISIYF